MTDVKICGLTTPDTLAAACAAGARYVGLVFTPASPRAVDRDTAYDLIHLVPTGVRSVGLFVDPDDGMLDHILARAPVDMIQLHGNETPDRVAAIRARFSRPVIKAIAIADKNDCAQIPVYEQVADWLLLDTKTALHGGSGRSFDWALLDGQVFTKPWMLAGGLTPDNVASAIAQLKPDVVDVSSGVEEARGKKSIAKINAFMDKVKSCPPL